MHECNLGCSNKVEMDYKWTGLVASWPKNYWNPRKIVPLEMDSDILFLKLFYVILFYVGFLCFINHWMDWFLNFHVH
jgi:hypothetical protein